MIKNIFLASSFLMLIACNSQKASKTSTPPMSDITYPATAKHENELDFFGTKVSDPYMWLENDTSAETAAWVKGQNEVTNSYLSQIPFREKIRKRYEELYNYEKYSAPFKEGKFTYYYKNSGLQTKTNYRCQKPAK